MKKYIFPALAIACMLSASAVFTACMNNDEETIIIESPSTGIPDDSQATKNPSVVNPTTQVPNIQTTLDEINGIPVIRVDMTGIKNAEGLDWLRLFGTGQNGQNVWVEVDGKPKGILVYNNSDDINEKAIKTDVVFSVDNSTSMADEADAIARDIVSWAQLLANSGLDVRFGVVGFGRNVRDEYSYLVKGYGVSGALDFTTHEELLSYLSRNTGVDRTVGYEGANKERLADAASAYSESGGECGVQAIRFADENLSFRSGANRIYVNFTDDANYTGNNSKISVEYMRSETTWPAYKGTIHSVISNSEANINKRIRNVGGAEQPWLISEYTGGTTLFTSSSFKGVTLESLPVTGAMENSYIIRFSNIDELLDGAAHKVHITVVSEDNTVKADKTFSVVFPKR